MSIQACGSAMLVREQHFLIKINENEYRVMEKEYRISKVGKNLGITICAKEVNGTIQVLI